MPQVEVNVEELAPPEASAATLETVYQPEETFLPIEDPKPQEIILNVENSAEVLPCDGLVDVLSLTVKKQREKSNCPACKKKLVHLPRHLVRVHGWSTDRAKKISCIMGTRKYRGLFTRKVRKTCTVKNCYAQVTRLGQHMKRVHGICLQPEAFYSQASSENTPLENTEFELQDKVKQRLSSGTGSTDEEEIDYTDNSDVVSTYWKEILLNYEIFLKGPAGGSLEMKTISYNIGRLKIVIADLEANNVQELLVEEKLWKYFGKKKTEKDWKSQTIITYLASLKKFFAYVSKKRKETPFSESEVTDAEHLCNIMPGWSRSYYKMCGEEKRCKRKEQEQLLLNSDKLDKFYSSEEYKGAVKIIEQLDDKYVPKRNDISLVRNILIFMGLIKNAKRGGVFAELRVSEFLQRERIEDRVVISIGKHKTSFTHDEANLVLTETENSYYQKYLKFMRSKIETEESGDYFFLSWGGTPTTASNVSNGIKKLGIASGIGALFPNIFRKSAATNIFYHCPEMAENVATHMDHEFNTAKKTYRLLNKKRDAVPSSKAIEAANYCDRPSYSGIRIEKIDEEKHNYEGSKNENISDECSDSESETSEMNSHSSTNSLNRKFSPYENRLIEKIFMDKIKKGENLSSKKVRNILDTKTPKLLNEYGEKKILAKVRWLKYRYKVRKSK